METRNILIMSGDKPIGAIQTLTVVSDGYTHNHLKITHARFDKTKLSVLFNKGFLHVASQTYPFDIVLYDDHVEVGRAKNVWISATDYCYESGDWIIVKALDAEAEIITGISNSSSNNLPKSASFGPIDS
jgi:hypothetical protein